MEWVDISPNGWNQGYIKDEQYTQIAISSEQWNLDTWKLGI